MDRSRTRLCHEVMFGVNLKLSTCNGLKPEKDDVF